MSGPCSLAALLWKLGPLLAMGEWGDPGVQGGTWRSWDPGIRVAGPGVRRRRPRCPRDLGIWGDTHASGGGGHRRSGNPGVWGGTGTPGVQVGDPGPQGTQASCAGNAALVLPPAEAPLVPLLVAELSREAGVLPPGLLNVVTGTPCLRRALRAHPHITAVTLLGAHQVRGRVLPHSGGRAWPGGVPVSPASPYRGSGHGWGGPHLPTCVSPCRRRCRTWPGGPRPGDRGWVGPGGAASSSSSSTRPTWTARLLPSWGARGPPRRW